jgi:hypothetical protein
VPYLIDGNNLIYAVAEVGPEVGRQGLVEMLDRWPGPDARVCVVFDGPAPPVGLARQIDGAGVEVIYSAGRTGDEIICERIASDSAPRTLHVVSTDREIRRAARRRRCRSIRSETFARELLAELRRANQPAPPPAEPPEKRTGVTDPARRRQWLREMGFDDIAEP